MVRYRKALRNSLSFFLSGQSPDRLYLTIRDGARSRSVEAREFLDQLWRTCAPFLDSDFREQAAVSFSPRFWEIYLVWTLLQNKISLRQPRHRRHSGKPDFCIASPVAWIEAILATPGEGDNAVPDYLSEEGGWFPEREIILRLRNALESKRKKHEKYLNSGAVSGKSVGQDATGQIAPELFLHVIRHSVAHGIGLVGQGEVRLEVLPDDAVQRGGLGTAPTIGLGVGVSRWPGWWCGPPGFPAGRVGLNRHQRSPASREVELGVPTSRTAEGWGGRMGEGARG